MGDAGLGDFVANMTAIAPAPQPRLRRDVDNLAGTLLLHRATGGLTAEDGAGQVEIHCVFVMVNVGGGGGVVGRRMERAAGIVDQNIDPAKGSHHFLKHTVNRILVHDIGGNAQRPTAQRLDFGHDGGRRQLFVVFGSGIEINVVDHHIRAQAGEMQYIRAAQTTPAARDNGDFAFEFHRVPLLFIHV